MMVGGVLPAPLPRKSESQEIFIDFVDCRFCSRGTGSTISSLLRKSTPKIDRHRPPQWCRVSQFFGGLFQVMMANLRMYQEILGFSVGNNHSPKRAYGPMNLHLERWKTILLRKGVSHPTLKIIRHESCSVQVVVVKVMFLQIRMWKELNFSIGLLLRMVST